MLDISVSNLEYSHKMIVMEVENHFVPRNELYLGESVTNIQKLVPFLSLISVINIGVTVTL